MTDNIDSITITQTAQQINVAGLGVLEMNSNERNDLFFKVYTSQHHTCHVKLIRDGRTAFRSYFNTNRQNKIQYFMICEGDIVEVSAYDSDYSFSFMIEYKQI